MNNAPRSIRVPFSSDHPACSRSPRIAAEEQQRALCRFVKITPGLLIRFIRAIAAVMDSGKRNNRELASHGWVYS